MEYIPYLTLALNAATVILLFVTWQSQTRLVSTQLQLSTRQVQEAFLVEMLRILKLREDDIKEYRPVDPSIVINQGWKVVRMILKQCDRHPDMRWAYMEKTGYAAPVQNYLRAVDYVARWATQQTHKLDYFEALDMSLPSDFCYACDSEGLLPIEPKLFPHLRQFVKWGISHSTPRRLV